MKDPKYELNIRWRPDDRCYVVSVRELPGCVGHGRTLEETVTMAREAISGYVESLQARGREPDPSYRLGTGGFTGAQDVTPLCSIRRLKTLSPAVT